MIWLAFVVIFLGVVAWVNWTDIPPYEEWDK